MFGEHKHISNVTNVSYICTDRLSNHTSKREEFFYFFVIRIGITVPLAQKEKSSSFTDGNNRLLLISMKQNKTRNEKQASRGHCRGKPPLGFPCLLQCLLHPLQANTSPFILSILNKTRTIPGKKEKVVFSCADREFILFKSNHLIETNACQTFHWWNGQPFA